MRTHISETTEHTAALTRASVHDDAAREAILYAIARRVTEEILGPNSWNGENVPTALSLADAGDELLKLRPPSKEQ